MSAQLGEARVRDDSSMWPRVRDDSVRSHLMSAQLGWTRVRDDSGMPQFKKRLNIECNRGVTSPLSHRAVATGDGRRSCRPGRAVNRDTCVVRVFGVGR